MATYYGAKYIKEQVGSILSQLGENDELVVSDDGSKDKTLDILRSFNDVRIKIYENRSKHGVVPNFENALKMASGDIIMFSDQDDIWRSDTIQVIKQDLKKSDFVVHNAWLINSEGVPLEKDYFSIRKTKLGYCYNLYKMSFLGCCMAFKKDCLKDILPFPTGILWHDMWSAAILNKKYKGYIENECLLYYRRHGENASPSGEKSTYSRIFQLKYRWTMLYNSLFR